MAQNRNRKKPKEETPKRSSRAEIMILIIFAKNASCLKTPRVVCCRGSEGERGERHWLPGYPTTRLGVVTAEHLRAKRGAAQMKICRLKQRDVAKRAQKNYDEHYPGALYVCLGSSNPRAYPPAPIPPDPRPQAPVMRCHSRRPILRYEHAVVAGYASERARGKGSGRELGVGGGNRRRNIA